MTVAVEGTREVAGVVEGSAEEVVAAGLEDLAAAAAGAGALQEAGSIWKGMDAQCCRRKRNWRSWLRG